MKHDQFRLHTYAPLDGRGEFCEQAAVEVEALVTVVATLTEGYDLDYIWQQVDRGPAKDAAGYYVQAGQSGGVEGDRPDEGGKSRPSYGHCAAT